MFGLDWLTPEMLAAAGLTAATAGAAAPALAGAAGAGAAGAGAAAGTGLTLGGVSAAVPFAAEAAAPAATGGLLGSLSSAGTQAMGYLDSANKVLKPVGQAASAANAVQGMFPQSAPVQTPPPQFGGGSQAFNGLLQDQSATDQARLQEEMKRREAQQKLIGLIGGM